MERWYVLQSKPQKERMLYEQLRLREFEVYYPSVRVDPVNPRARKYKSYFPGYMFVRVDLDLVGLSALKWVPGAVGLVNFGGEPASISEHILQAIRTRIEKSIADPFYFYDGLKAGDPVSISEGPFAGYIGIFDARLSGNQRVRVLLELLQDQKLRVELPVRYLKRVQ
jgi:transcriptional antiterminator RfaH